MESTESISAEVVFSKNVLLASPLTAVTPTPLLTYQMD